MKLRRYLIGLILCNVIVGFARDQNLNFKHLTTSEGLSNNSIQTIFQDQKGFLWFGTDDGLNMYDGYEFSLFKYNSSIPSSLSSNTIYKIIEDSRGDMWLAGSNGIDIFERDLLQFKHIPFFFGQDKNYESYNRAIDEDQFGQVILANTEGVFVYDTNRGGFVRFFDYIGDSIQQPGIRDMLVDKLNRIWIGSVGYGLYGYDLTNKKVIASAKNPHVINLKEKFYCLNEDKEGNIWAGTERGIFIIKSDLSSINHIDLFSKVGGLGTNMVLKIYFENEDRIWIATEGGLISFNPQKNEFNLYTSKENNQNSLNNSSISTILIDKQGIIWLGTYQGGINYCQLQTNKKFNLFRNERGNINSISYNAVSAIFEDSDGILWIGTDGGGLDAYNPETKKYTHYGSQTGNHNSISGNSILAIAEDKSGNIWFGGYMSGIDILNKKTGRYSHLKNIPGNINSLSNNDVRDFIFTDDGNVWIITNGGGLNIYNPETNSFTRYQEGQQNTIVSNWGIDLFKSSRGEIFIGTYNGLSICDPKSMNFYNYNKSQLAGILSNNWIYSFAEDKDGNIWIGTANGINIFNTQTRQFSIAINSSLLPNEVINGILIDDNNEVWLSTNGGIARYNPQNKKLRTYTVSDGLQGRQFIHGSYFKSLSGKMFFGGLNGFNSFYPGDIQDNSYIPDVFLRDFLIFYKSVNAGGEDSHLTQSIEMLNEIILNPTQSVITFKYAALNFVNPEKNQYAYMLEGMDDDWIDVGVRREATYTNLNPGTYYFKVKASNDDGYWNQKGTSVKLIILPPWWKTWFFRITLIIVIVALLLFIFFMRVNSLKKQKILLEKLVEKRTHEILEKNLALSRQADELNEINSLLEEKQQRIQQQAEFLSEANSLLEERQQQIGEQTEELMAQKDELEKVNTHLRELNSTKDKFFSIIAHDLKNPFGTILGFAELLSVNYDKIAEKKRKDFISIIFRSSQNLFNLLENLLLWSRSQTNRIIFEPVIFDINALIEENLSLVDEMYKHKEIQVLFSPAENPDVYADRNMISTVIRNLITNAIKFTRVRGKIEITAHQNDSSFEFAIRDNGIGMAKADADHVFSTDVHYSKEGTEGEAGTGLGLILCKEYIDKHMGKIWVESKEGEGSSFFFTIPG